MGTVFAVPPIAGIVQLAKSVARLTQRAWQLCIIGSHEPPTEAGSSARLFAARWGLKLKFIEVSR